MKGINYITDTRGNKTAVVIGMKNYKEEVEDFLIGLEAQNRLEETALILKKQLIKS